MSAPESGGCAGRAGRGQRPSAAPGALPSDAAAVGSASLRAGGGSARLAAATPVPGAAEQPPPSSPRASTLAAADAPRAGLAALSLLPPGPGDGAAAGGGGPATRPAPPPASTSRGASSSSSGVGASATSYGAFAHGGCVPGLGPSAAAASAPPSGDTSVPGDTPPEPVGDDGLALSAEAAASPFSPPASERHAAFLKLVDSATKARLQRRCMRAAHFSALAAEAGAVLFGDDSLIVAELRVDQAQSLWRQSAEEAKRGDAAGEAEEEALERRAWVVLLAQALPVLQGRLDRGTLLPGRLRRVEGAYFVYTQQLCARLRDKLVPSEASVRRAGVAFGYNAALFAAATALDLLPWRPWRGGQRERARAFVLAVLRLIPLTGGLPIRMPNEACLVDTIEHYMTSDSYGADFCASVLAVWRSPAVTDVLRSRGLLRSAAAAAAAVPSAAFKARQAADLAKPGLRRCALPSCGKQEMTVLHFRVCGHCHTTRYCCPEHAEQHWKAHKRKYEE